MIRRALYWVAFVCVLTTLFGFRSLTGQQSPASGSVSGIVVTTENPPRPVRRAIVSLRGADTALGHHAITDDAGRFEIGELPAGRYELSAKRPAFVTIAYGASRPEWPGTPLAISVGQRLSDLTVRLAPGAVITGTVRDETGVPTPGLEVWLERQRANAGPFQKVGTTDSQGTYRLFGLPAGSYVVSVRPLKTSRTVNYASSDAEVDAVLRQLQQGRYGAPQLQTGQMSAVRSTVSDYAPIYYPSAIRDEDAVSVLVVDGEERAGIDMTIRRFLTTRIRGRVEGSDTSVGGNTSVQMVRASRDTVRPTVASILKDGTFEFASVSPGRYQIVMWRGQQTAQARATCEFAAATVEVAGDEPPEVRLRARPCLKVAGRVEIATDSAPGVTAQVLSGAAVRFIVDRSQRDPVYTQLPIMGPIGTDGTFTLGGNSTSQFVPGSYVIDAGVLNRTPGTGWWLQSARTADGRDILDSPLTLTDGSPETTQIVLTFSDRHTSLSGQLTTAAGRPAIDYTVIAFTRNQGWWRQPFRRVLTTRPATDGGFVLRDLPPGDYYLAALVDVAPNEWLDPAFLRRIADQAVPLTIAPGEQKVQSLQIRAR